MKEILFIPFVVLCYLLWLPCAILKDISCIIYTPFDIQRLYNTIGAARTNLRKGFKFFKNFKDEEEKEEEKKSIGFQVMPSVFPGHDSIASGLGCVDEEFFEEDEDED